jgi:hypothetical protein
LETITGKAAEFPMLFPKGIQFFPLNGRPPRGLSAPGFRPLQTISFFSNLPGCFLPTTTFPGRFKQSFSRTVRRSVANGDGCENLRKSGRTKTGRVD